MHKLPTQKTKRFDLDGLTLVVVEMPHVHTLSTTVGIKVGSRYETNETAGISHFLEHMLFRGTREFPSTFEFNEALELVGGQINASTRPDHTLYYTAVPAAEYRTSLHLLSQMTVYPLLRDVDVERDVVIEELLESLGDDGKDNNPDELVVRSALGDHPVARKIAGTKASLRSIGKRELKAWHRKHYTRENMIVVMCGPLSAAVAKREVEKAFQDLPKRKSKARAQTQAAPPVLRNSFRLRRESGLQTELRLAVPLVGLQKADVVPLALLSRVLDDGMSARVFRTMVEEKGLAYEAFGGMEFYEELGLLTLGATTSNKKVVNAVASLLGLLDELGRGGVTERELLKAKARTQFDFLATLDDPSSLAELLASRFLVRGDIDLPAWFKQVQTTEAKDLARIAAHYLGNARHIVAVGELSDAAQRRCKELLATPPDALKS